MKDHELLEELMAIEADRHAAVIESIHHLAQRMASPPSASVWASGVSAFAPAPDPVEPPESAPTKRKPRAPAIVTKGKTPKKEPRPSPVGQAGGGYTRAAGYRKALAGVISLLAEPFGVAQANEALLAECPEAASWVRARNVVTSLMAFAERGWLDRKAAGGPGRPASYTRTARFAESLNDHRSGVEIRYGKFAETVKRPIDPDEGDR